MSPLLFVICMEYLTRTLKCVGEKEHFQFHRRSVGIKFNHLCFTDDVILCSKGNFVSVYTMLPRFKHFSEVSGLEVNEAKSEVYTTGMRRNEIQRILDASGFKLGTLPFKYLGVPIGFKRIEVKECMKLVEKMTARIRSWSSRHLYYQGRLVLVNSVLMSIHIYWAQVFALPKKIL